MLVGLLLRESIQHTVFTSIGTAPTTSTKPLGVGCLQMRLVPHLKLMDVTILLLLLGPAGTHGNSANNSLWFRQQIIQLMSQG